MSFSREVIKSSKKIRRKKAFEIFSVAVFVSVFLFVSWGYLFQDEKFLITSMTIDGNSSIKTRDIFNYINSKLSERYALLFPTNNILIYPRGDIENGLLDKYLKIESMKISYEGFNKLIITVKERKPAFVLCEHPTEDEKLKADVTDKCFYADKDGLVYEPAPNFSEGVLFVFSEERRLGGVLNKNILPVEDFHKLLGFKDEVVRLAKIKAPAISKISEIELKDFGDVDLVVNNEQGVVSKILISTQAEDLIVRGKTDTASVLNSNKDSLKTGSLEQILKSTLKNFETVVSSPVFISALNKKDSALEYLDLRFGKKVFYKFGLIKPVSPKSDIISYVQ